MNKWLANVVSFWLWISVVLVSFMMIVISLVVSAIPQVAVTIFAVVIFAAALAVPIINPGIFAKQTTSSAAG